MSVKNKIKECSNNATIAAIISSVVAFILGIIGSSVFNEVRYHDAVTYNNISSYIESEMVDPGLIKDNVLLLETPFEQIKAIADVMNKQKGNFDDLANEKENLVTELKQMKDQKAAKLSSPELKILGENINTTYTDYMASIDGHTYYLEGFLNDFLPEKITNNEGVIQYGEESPEKINAISEGLAYDESGMDVCKGDTYFTMGKKDYSFGIMTKGYTSGKVNIDCNGKYSEMSFVIGHINNTDSANQTLTLSYLDADNIFKKICAIELNDKIPIQTVTIPIHNTKIVQITTEPNNGAESGQYGIADIYLIK